MGGVTLADGEHLGASPGFNSTGTGRQGLATQSGPSHAPVALRVRRGGSATARRSRCALRRDTSVGASPAAVPPPHAPDRYLAVGVISGERQSSFAFYSRLG